MAHLLITGGAGFIGSHTCLAFLEAGHSVVAMDNYSNSSIEALKRVKSIAGVGSEDRIKIIEGDIRNSQDLDNAFMAWDKTPDGVIHFAGLKSVGESLSKPLLYWDVNVKGTISLLNAMQRHACRTIVFSSSATVYGHPPQRPLKETCLIDPINPYGQTKAVIERLLADLSGNNEGWRIASLRYFNPVGAHPSGLIGEDPSGTPNNLFPFLTQVIVGNRDELKVFGGDWPTNDGTPIRDYIHVMDLAEGHLAAYEVLQNEIPQNLILNLGSGKGHSVLDVILAFEQILGKKVPYRICSRRLGDVAYSVADPSLASKRLGWMTSRTLLEMTRDALSWQELNPFGYKQK